MMPNRLNNLLLICVLFCFSSNAGAESTSLASQLNASIRQGNVRAVKQLIARGSKVNSPPGSKTPLMYAAETGNVAMLKFLLAKGAKVKAQDRPGNLTALLYAKNYDCVKALLDAGANPNEADIDGETVLLKWIGNSQEEQRTAELLISRGANVNCTDVTGHSALWYAVQAGNAKILNLLLKHGAKQSIDDPEDTALMLAKQKKRADLVSLLMQASRKKKLSKN